MRAMGLNRLSSRKVDTVKEAGRYADGGGLYLQVTKTGSKSWLFMYSLRGGKRREKGLGSLASVGLAAAREKAEKLRGLIADGLDPMEVRERPDNVPSFGEVATALINDLEVGWKNPKHRQQWRNTLATYCAPIWATAVDLVDTDAIVEILKPLWSAKPETGSRVRARIERVLDSAKVKGHRTGENPARWGGHLKFILPGSTRGSGVRHHPALPYDQVADFVKGLKTRISTAARALEFLIHTAARTGEVIGALWREIDFEAKTWTIPAERMKMKRVHIVPLTEAALTVLRAMAVVGTDPDAPVFPSRNGKHLSNMSMEMLLRRMGCDDFTVHGFRSSFRDWAADTGYANDWAEAALAHSVASQDGKTVAAYKRTTFFQQREETLMPAWSAFVAGEEVAMAKAA